MPFSIRKKQCEEEKDESNGEDRYRGGHVVPVPSWKEITDVPRGIPGSLWACLLKKYNVSQLFAMKYVSDQMDSTQDTKISLIQGPVSFDCFQLIAFLFNVS